MVFFKPMETIGSVRLVVSSLVCFIPPLPRLNVSGGGGGVIWISRPLWPCTQIQSTAVTVEGTEICRRRCDEEGLGLMGDMKGGSLWIKINMNLQCLLFLLAEDLVTNKQSEMRRVVGSLQSSRINPAVWRRQWRWRWRWWSWWLFNFYFIFYNLTKTCTTDIDIPHEYI